MTGEPNHTHPELEARIAAIEAKLRGSGDTSPSIPKALSIREFLLTASPQSDVETTLLVAYFLELQEGNESFNVEDLRRGFYQAKEPLPANLNDAVNKNVRKGLIMEHQQQKGGTKAWVLTSSGERFVSERQNTAGGKR